MSENTHEHYKVIERAIAFLRSNYLLQPSLEEVAAQVHMSPYHFQRVFTEWAGVSPKKFTQYLSVSYAKSLLVEEQPSLFETALRTGLSGGGRLHDLFVQIEGMTPGEFKKGGVSVNIQYGFHTSSFGDLIIASTEKGICYLAFIERNEEGLKELKKRFPGAKLKEANSQFQEQAMTFFAQKNPQKDKIPLHLRGTPFQLKVWEALLKIPEGRLMTYGQIAKEIGQSGASRAVGTAIGSNPIACIIPCHRVIQKSGIIGGYRWGVDRKSALIGWEAAQIRESN